MTMAIIRVAFLEIRNFLDSLSLTHYEAASIIEAMMHDEVIPKTTKAEVDPMLQSIAAEATVSDNKPAITEEEVDAKIPKTPQTWSSFKTSFHLFVSATSRGYARLRTPPTAKPIP
jgi:hypothetical protein